VPSVELRQQRRVDVPAIGAPSRIVPRRCLLPCEELDDLQQAIKRYREQSPR